MHKPQSILSIILLLSIASAHAKNIWVVNLTNNPIISVTFLLFHKKGREILGSNEKREFKHIAPWSKSGGQSMDSFKGLSRLVVKDRGSKLCAIMVKNMQPSNTTIIQRNPYETHLLFDCTATPAFLAPLIVWDDCTLIVENDPTPVEKITKKVSHYKMTLENNSPYLSKYLQEKNDEKPIGNWETPKTPFKERFNKKPYENTFNR